MNTCQHDRRVRIAWNILATCVFWSMILYFVFSNSLPSVFGQIVAPKEAEEHHPIPISVEADVPTDGKILRDGPGWIFPPGLNVYEVSPTEYVVCGKPGEYLVQYKIRWIQLQEVKFTDGDGKEITIWSYIGSGNYATESLIKITKEGGDDPIPDPTPALIDRPGLSVLIVRESSQPMPKAHQAILTGTAWQRVAGAGNWLVIDPDTKFLRPSPWKEALDKTADKGLPRLVISKQGVGAWVGKLPADNAAMLALVQEWKGR